MNILLVAATWMEVNLLVDELEKTGEIHGFEYNFRNGISPCNT